MAVPTMAQCRGERQKCPSPSLCLKEDYLFTWKAAAWESCFWFNTRLGADHNHPQRPGRMACAISAFSLWPTPCHQCLLYNEFLRLSGALAFVATALGRTPWLPGSGGQQGLCLWVLQDCNKQFLTDCGPQESVQRKYTENSSSQSPWKRFTFIF